MPDICCLSTVALVELHQLSGAVVIYIHCITHTTLQSSIFRSQLYQLSQHCITVFIASCRTSCGSFVYDSRVFMNFIDLFCCRTFYAVEMIVFFYSKMQLISRQVLLSWKQLAMLRSFTTRLGQNWKFIGRNMSIKEKCSSIRYISTSSPLQDVKQLTSETAMMDDEASPAEILANLSAEDEKRLKVLKLEYDVFASTGIRVPDFVRDEDWVYLLYNCPSPSSREQYYRFLFKREKVVENDRQKRAAHQLAHEERRKQLEQMKLDGTYEFLNTYRLRTLESTMNSWAHNNICYALMNGPHLVFDFSFEEQMNERELRNLVRQVKPT